jgi:MFS family permease
MPTALRAPHPSVYAILIIPFGAVSGYVSVAMVFLATRFGLTVEDGAILVAAGMLPHVWKFFWAPIVDTTLTRKWWYRISVLLCAIGITAMSAIPLGKQNLHLLQGVIFLASLASTFLGMAVEGLMAHATPPEQRGWVSGWFQAGNLGGTGLGGGAGLWMATNLPSAWMSGAALGVAFLLGATLLTFVPEAAAESRTKSITGMMVDVAKDLWTTIKSPKGVMCALLCVVPICTGAATSVLSQAEVAAKWGCDERTVELVNGLLNGVLSAIGCLVGGAICSRMSSQRFYAIVAVLMALAAVGMAFSPFTKPYFIGWTLIYVFIVGLSYAAFTGFVLDAIGKGAAATKYNGFASLSNLPITYMGLVLAGVYTTYGVKNMLLVEAGAAVIGLAVFGTVGLIVKRWEQRQPVTA